METNGSGNAISWMDTPAGQQVQARLSEERTLKAIDHLLDRIDTLEQAVDRLGDLMQRGPGMVAMVGDMADEAYRKADANGISIDQRLTNALSIAEQLTTPEMLAKIENLVKITDQAPGMIAMVADMSDEAYRKADAGGINIDQRLDTALKMAAQLTAPEVAVQLDALLKFGDQFPGLLAMTVDFFDESMRKAIEHGFDPGTLASVSAAANTALTVARAEHPTKSGGIFKLMRSLNDPDLQKGLGFFMNFLKHFGQNL